RSADSSPPAILAMSVSSAVEVAAGMQFPERWSRRLRRNRPLRIASGRKLPALRPERGRGDDVPAHRRPRRSPAGKPKHMALMRASYDAHMFRGAERDPRGRVEVERAASLRGAVLAELSGRPAPALHVTPRVQRRSIQGEAGLARSLVGRGHESLQP